MTFYIYPKFLSFKYVSKISKNVIPQTFPSMQYAIVLASEQIFHWVLYSDDICNRDYRMSQLEMSSKARPRWMICSDAATIAYYGCP